MEDVSSGDTVILRGTASLPKHRFTKEVEKRLTAVPAKASTAPGSSRSFPVFCKMGDRVLVPKFTYLSTLRRPDDRIEIDEAPLETDGFGFLGEFFEEQKDGVDRLVTTLSKRHGVTGKGRCGTGKTVIGTNLLSRVRSKKSAILVDQTNIAEQWAEELRTHLPDVRISFVMPRRSQRHICEKLGLSPDDRPIVDLSGDVVVVMAQTLNKRMCVEDPIRVTLLIVDEAHKFSAPRFSQCIFNFSFRYSLSLTATDERADGLSWVFKEILGPSVVQLGGRRMNPVVVTVPSPLKTPIRMQDHKMSWCRTVEKTATAWFCRTRCPEAGGCRNKVAGAGRKVAFYEIWERLAQDREHNKTVLMYVREMYRANRQVIVFSKFKAHLALLRNATIRLGIPEEKTSLYFGGMDKDACLAPQITFATYGVCEHGLNAPHKDMAILAMPRSEVEQVVGRVERKREEKRIPLIIDPVTKGMPFFENQAKRRLKFYKRAGYDIESGGLPTVRRILGHRDRDAEDLE